LGSLLIRKIFSEEMTFELRHERWEGDSQVKRRGTKSIKALRESRPVWLGLSGRRT
jgi:hypothetical protein